MEVCHECAAWLARARQTDVLLKPLADTRPSDSVRNAILSQLRNDGGLKPNPTTPPPVATTSAASSQGTEAEQKPAATVAKPKLVSRPFHTFFSSLLLRFDPSPGRIAVGSFAVVCASLGILFWLNVLPQFWSNKLGFEVQPDSAGVGSTPISIQAISSGQNGSDASNAPQLVLAQPGDGAQVSLLDTPMIMRFDMPMDRGSVEDALLITPPAAGKLLWDADNQVRWIPSEPGLLRGITYTVELTGTPISLAGTPLEGNRTWSFHTSEPHAVKPSIADGSSIGPDESLSLTFDAPMQAEAAQSAVSVRLASTNEIVPALYSWDGAATQLSIRTVKPLPAGNVSVIVDASAPTQSGDTLGRSYEFVYRSVLPSSRVRLLDGHLLFASVGQLVRTSYEAVSESPSGGALSGVSFEIYTFPSEKLSLLGAQNSAWPQLLPAGFPAGLDRVATADSPISSSSSSGDAFLPALPAGIYLVVAQGLSLKDGELSGAHLADWQLLIVSDYKLQPAGMNIPLWAIDDLGRAWVGAEVSLYGPDGGLITKGMTDDHGLYSIPPTASGATLAIARDPSGHIAPVALTPPVTLQPASDMVLPASLVTDRPAYRPGDVVNFHAIIQLSTAFASDAARLAEPETGNITAQLLTPHGYVVSSLSLKADASGAIGGLFSLAPDIAAGQWTIRVRLDDIARDFPLAVVPAARDTLSVAVLPTAADEDMTTITRTVSVLNALGKPVEGAVVTAKLGIEGDQWTSKSMVLATDSSGFADFVMPLPSWLDRFNDPGLFFQADVTYGGSQGSATVFLDLTSQRMAASGLTQAVSPLQNVAVVARITPAQLPDIEASFKVRAVLLDPGAPSGSTLLIATSPQGDTLPFTLDLAAFPGGDATITLPLRFAGGTITIMSANHPAPRVLGLIPADLGVADMHIIAPASAEASSQVPLKLSLGSLDGMGMAGDATLVWRRAGGSTYDLPASWEPSVAITSSGALTLTMQAPTTPGLWYLLGSAATANGTAHSWTAIRVLPSPWVQTPAAAYAEAGLDTVIGLRIFNPTDIALDATLRPGNNTAARQVYAPAHGWADQTWKLSAGSAGASTLDFSLSSGALTWGGWPMTATYTPHLQTNFTYTAGTITGERNVGVAVPWDISGGKVSLEIRASTSLLSALSGIARDLYNAPSAPADGVSSAAARLSAGSPVASAYGRTEGTLPDSLLLSSVEISSLMQQLYSAQHSDGSWGTSLAGDGTGTMGQTAAVLLAFYRSSYYPYSDGHLQADPTVVQNALNYLEAELSRPIAMSASQATLDARAYALYAYSLYRSLPADWARPMLAYVLRDASGLADSLSVDGQGYLALAFMQQGATDDALALLDTTLRVQPAATPPASAPMLIALLQAEAVVPPDGQPFNATYATVRNPQSPLRNSRYVDALMQAREGSGWHTPLITADALWALSLYAALEQQNVRSDMPGVYLGDRPIQATTSTGIPGELSVLLSGDQLKAGTNWLKLRSPSPGEPLYYSLTLIATR